MTTSTVLITGTSSGIGLEAAVAAARAGWHTVATMRDTAKAGALRAAAEAAGVADLVEIRRLDVTDPDSAAACVAAVVADHGALHAVINNAGAGHVGTLEVDGVEAARRVMEVNFFGVLNVTAAAMPHLRATGGRLVAVTSVGGVVGQPFNEAYCAAKFAVEGYLESLTPVAATVGVSVTVVEPAAVASEFVANVGVPDDRSELLERMGPYTPALEAYLARTAGAFANAQSAADAAAAVVAVLTAERPAPRVQTSDAARAFIAGKLADPDGTRVVGVTSTWVA
ncbi:short-chain dehydrogenase/reductase [Kitasatospora herbaricolor]|uniref:SDR family NAD(P)-dependent oxidoreductase n=1 Tax=Kitasatospora herbaricolor TaxID=68217 RepID=UPI0017480BAD|nr:SDR family NAD(P)-dependent oxidoreductase [Kitasatospora herbaricolor]MDQ0311881.1 NAD(P)-dependent dehydrogenase (short-subunit alcohol dehydrogenase family) [Kitasatospora herbaricolor]GGU96987.1 short-chain dehydrogenase/reductase [Kitasatospora herbaricolor]